MSDLIYIQDAIIELVFNEETKNIKCEDMRKVLNVLKKMPSTEPKLDNENGELIYRQDSVKTMYDLCEYIDDESLHIDVIVDALENLPSASTDLSIYSDKLWKIAYERGKAEGRKKGKWLRCGNHHLCSECDEWALTRWDEDECDEVDILTDFCPNCGADMRGEEE